MLIVVADRATLGKARDRRVRPADHDLVVGIGNGARTKCGHGGGLSPFELRRVTAVDQGRARSAAEGR